MMTAREKSVVQFGNTSIPYKIRRSPRRKTVAVSVDRQNGVMLTAPLEAGVPRLDRVVRDKARWILDRLRHVQQAEAELPEREFVSGESYQYLGRHYRLKVVRRAHSGEAKLERGWLVVPVSTHANESQRAELVRESLETWYRRHAAQRLPERVSHWHRRVGVPVPKVIVKNQLKRWGSCDSKGNIRFNWRIIQAPMRLVDYVVVHELVHLLHKNHTKDYWATLGRVMPDYEKRRHELRKVGPRLEW